MGRPIAGCVATLALVAAAGFACAQPQSVAPGINERFLEGHFEFPQIILQAIHASRKPGGTFIVIDFERIPGVSSERILSHVRAGKETVIKEVEAEGFRMVEERKIMQQNYFVRFVKK